MTVSAIIDKFGGLSEFARKTDVPVQTASSWKSNNYIPRWRRSVILDAALSLKLDISPSDFPEKLAA